MTIQHTPGPWTVFDEKWGIGVTAPQADIAHCSGFDTNRSRDEERVNARLIAASPELLDALEPFAKLFLPEDLDIEPMGGDEEYHISRDVVRAARAAIAKARGE